MIKKAFHQDFYRMTGSKYKRSFSAYFQIFQHHNLQYMWIWRKYEISHRKIWKFFLHHFTCKYGLEISPAASIGEGLYLGHPYNITVAEGVILGKNVNLHKGSTIGRENRGKRMGTPTIGNCVSVGINATIVGKITIGSDVLIAPNSFVNFDVPDHSIVVGNPGIIHPREHATHSYVNFLV